MSAQLCSFLQKKSQVQSGFRPRHSTETALVKITNDLLLASDQGCISLLVLLDLSAAFDTIDHDILIDRLQNYTGIQGQALRWFRSYLFDHYHFVYLNGEASQLSPVKYGVPPLNLCFNKYLFHSLCICVPSCWPWQNLAFNLEIKVPESGGRQERHKIQAAWSPVWSFRSQWWFGVSLRLLVLVYCVLSKSKVNAAVYPEILELFILFYIMLIDIAL